MQKNKVKTFNYVSGVMRESIKFNVHFDEELVS